MFSESFLSPSSAPSDGVALIPARSEALLSACLAVRSEVFTKEYGIPQTMERDAADALGTGCEHFLVRLNGQDAGALRCVCPAPGVVRLQRFCILSDLRGHGIGRAVLAALEEFYRDRAGQFELDAKFRVEGFYLACGYRTVSDVFMEAGVPHVKMIKKL